MVSSSISTIPELFANSCAALIAHSITPDHSHTSPGLPDDQWKREARRWFETGLAKFQYKAMEFTNISYPEVYVIKDKVDSGITLAQNLTQIPGVDALLNAQCQTQLVKLNGRGQNVSVLGLSVLLIIMALAFSAAKLLNWWGDKPTKHDGRRRRWQEDEYLALWAVARDVPDTKSTPKTEQFALLDGHRNQVLPGVGDSHL